MQIDLRSSQPHAWRRTQEQFHDGRQQHDYAGVEGEHAERPGRLTGVEIGLFAAKAMQTVEQRTNRLFQFKGLRRRLHMQGHAYEQLIVEIAAQARQRLVSAGCWVCRASAARVRLRSRNSISSTRSA